MLMMGYNVTPAEKKHDRDIVTESFNAYLNRSRKTGRK
jgi:hypothetical protein